MVFAGYFGSLLDKGTNVEKRKQHKHSTFVQQYKYTTVQINNSTNKQQVGKATEINNKSEQ
jgi:hypothetical protein